LSNVLDIKKLFDCFVDVSSGRARVAVMLEHPAVQRDAAMKDALWTAVKTASAAAAATAKANAAAAAAAAGGSAALKPNSSSSTSYSSSSYASSYGSGTQLSLKLSELMAAVFTYAKDEELRRMQHAVDIARLLERVRERLVDEACHLEVATASTDTLHGHSQNQHHHQQQQQQQQHRVRHPSALSSNSSAKVAGGSSSSAARAHSAHHKGASPATAAADTSGTISAATVLSPRAGAATAWHNGEALLNKKGHAIHLPLSAMQDIAQVCNCYFTNCHVIAALHNV
jgi:hypothetical protein